MEDGGNDVKKRSAGRSLFGAWIVLVMLLVLAVGTAEGTTANTTTSTMHIKNGSFEEEQTFTKDYDQPLQQKVPDWNTTAFEGKIELFRTNTGTYISGVTLTPQEGTYAAELNADEESTLYQVLDTEPSSIYEWGLYHGSRTQADTMALIIGPNQADGDKCLLSKPNKQGRDQFMQMVDWLKKQSIIDESKYAATGLYDNGTPQIVYSKQFDDNGTFKDNADNNPFSLTPSTIYTEQWYIWLMRAEWSTSGTNRWYPHGAAAGSSNKYYHYTVPAEQNKTLFGFVSVDSAKRDPTFGNFIDDINFKVYHNITASRTAHGTAEITLPDASLLMPVDESKHSAYAAHGTTLTLTATIGSSNVAFAGIFYKTNAGGSRFIPSSEWTNTITGKYTKTLTVNGECDLHFVFIKSPTITYDANGGDSYDCGQGSNVYSFQPTINGTDVTLVAPYTSHAAKKTTGGTSDPDWRFTGWLLMDDHGQMVTLDDTTGEHRVACNYSFLNSSSSGVPQQPFLVIGRENPADSLPTFDNAGTVTETDSQNNSYELKRWAVPANATVHYNNNAAGLTFIAQWKWRQTFIPKVPGTGGWVASNAGGTIAVTPTSTESGTNYETYYFAEQAERITVTATPKAGYQFNGWYDSAGKLVTTKNTFSYTVSHGDVNVYEARFVGTAQQTYIRQIPDENGNGWRDLANDDSTVAGLDRYSLSVAPGDAVSCTVGSDTGNYTFIGWYDSAGNPVTTDRTLGYNVTGPATYYARFVPKVYFLVRYLNSSNAVVSPPVTGEACGTVTPAEATGLVPGEPISSVASPNLGYRFVGWYDSEAADRNLLTNERTFTGSMPPVSKTYYAMFMVGDTSQYKVQHIKVKPNGSTEIASEATVFNVTTGEQVSAQSISIPGYTYQANSFTVNGTTYTSNSSGKVRGDGQLVLRLYYQANTGAEYKIEYYKLDAQKQETLVDTETKTAQTDAEVSVTVRADKYPGYTWAAHYGKNKLSGIVTPSGEPQLVLKVYYQLEPHRVNFDMHGFGVQVPYQSVPHNEKATRPDDPTDLDVVFDGWYTDNTYTTLYDFDTLITQDTTIHAKWKMRWTVTFELHDHGEPIAAQKVEDGKFADEPTPPTADGYEFHGWYTNTNYAQEYHFTTTPVTQDITLHAKWTASVTVTKEWAGRETEVTVRLLRDGLYYSDMPDTNAVPPVPQTCEQVLNSTNQWTHTWSNLPPDSEYTVVEDVPDDCTAVYEQVSKNNWKITNVRDKQIDVTVRNTHAIDTIGMVIRKEWDDANNRNRPGSVRVCIKNAGTGAVIQTHELSAANNWTWNVAGLPKRQNGGETVRYLVEEVGTTAGYSVSCEIVIAPDGSYTVSLTNVLTGKLDLDGTKVWNDDGDRDRLRPDSVQLKIYQNAIADANLVRIVLVTADANSSVNDPWTWHVEDLPVYDAFGQPITYIVVEDPVPDGYVDPGPQRITVTP